MTSPLIPAGEDTTSIKRNTQELLLKSEKGTGVTQVGISDKVSL